MLSAGALRTAATRTGPCSGARLSPKARTIASLDGRVLRSRAASASACAPGARSRRRAPRAATTASLTSPFASSSSCAIESVSRQAARSEPPSTSRRGDAPRAAKSVVSEGGTTKPRVRLPTTWEVNRQRRLDDRDALQRHRPDARVRAVQCEDVDLNLTCWNDVTSMSVVLPVFTPSPRSIWTTASSGYSERTRLFNTLRRADVRKLEERAGQRATTTARALRGGQRTSRSSSVPTGSGNVRDDAPFLSTGPAAWLSQWSFHHTLSPQRLKVPQCVALFFLSSS